MIDADSSPNGALVISLDFELMWGVRDRIGSGDPYMVNVRGARAAIPRLLELFEEFDVAATWATVGFLFAASRMEREALTPSLRPSYADPRLSPYDEKTGDDEEADPLHFAGSLIERIRRTSRQEIATHTFSHYYAGEKGQNQDTFRADLDAALAIASHRGIEMKSIVFPRNQHNPRYDNILIEKGIRAFRGNPTSYAWQFTDNADSRGAGKRALRLLDSYLGVTGAGTTSWSRVLQANGLSNVRASYPIRPYIPQLKSLDPVRLKRIKNSIRHAATNREILHIWWHPHNFGRYTDENLRFLRQVLEDLNHWRHKEAMISLTMAEVAEKARVLGRSTAAA
jgi:peptidoglycan/xylan/chitin deacetylase (PgdA/CDA1 family)